MKCVICAIIKNEHKYIKEWVQYNLNIGFAAIYLYEDFGSTSHYNILRPWIDKKQVVLVPLENNSFGITDVKLNRRVKSRGTQAQLFDFFIKHAKKHKLADWVGFFDVDEFLTFQADYNLRALISEFNNYPGIMLAWLLYNANGLIKNDTDSVLNTFTKHLPISVYLDGIRWNHKSLINLKKVKGKTQVHEWKGCVHTDYNKSLNHICYDKAYIAHYYTKSFEEYATRMLTRGNMGNNQRSFDQFFNLNQDMLKDEAKLLDSVRFNSYGCDVMYISRKHNLIAGGNKNRLKQLQSLIV